MGMEFKESSDRIEFRSPVRQKPAQNLDVKQDIPEDIDDRTDKNTESALAYEMSEIQDIPDDMPASEIESQMVIQDIPDDVPGAFAHENVHNDGFENSDIEQIMDNFREDNWEGLSEEEKKEALNELAEYTADDLGLDNPPNIEYYNSDDQGDYGGYSEADNTIYINASNLHDSAEAADTIAHETRHCYQYECADDPNSREGSDFKENLDNYITPDIDFEAYQEQPVEADARAYAQEFKDMINR